MLAIEKLISDTHALCLCGSNLPYQICCRPYHLNEKYPTTAAQLMRSRFTAYALRNSDYLQATWDVHKRPKHIDFSQETVRWLKLDIIALTKGTAQDQRGIVEFKAFYSLAGQTAVMHEISRFKKIANRWFYVDGVVKSIVNTDSQVIQQNRNALCACGSGKKFKRCCAA